MGSAEMENISDLIEKSFYGADTDQVYSKIIYEIQKIVIIKALERSCGNQLKAAKILGIHRNTLKAKICKFGISPEKWKI